MSTINSLNAGRVPVRHALIFAPVLLSLLFSGCSWFGGDEEEDPPAELVKFKSTLKVKKAWSSGIGGGSQDLRLALGPATDGTLIFAGAHDGKIAAFDAVKGKRRWLVKTKLPLSAGPGISDGMLVAGSSNGDVIALNAESGEEIWRTSVSSEVLATPAISSKFVLVRTVDGKLVALQRDDGSEAWFVQQSVPRLSVRGTGAPVVSNNIVICGFDNGKLAAYEMSDGSLIWEVLLAPPAGRTEIDRLSDLNDTVRLVGDDVYIAGYQGGVSSLALESGQILWTRDISSHSGIAVDFNNLYVSGKGSDLHAITRQAGREIWQVATLLNRDVTGPTPYRGSVVVGDFDGYLHWLSAATGEFQARVRAGSDRITSAPLVVNEMIYVLTDDGKLFAFKDMTPLPES
jgi:outer membrane protein assembly factor BamB